MDAKEKATPSYPRVVSKPVGGFRAVGLLQICMAWWAYRTGVLREYLDFRVYLALHEFDEQRLTARRVRARNRLPSSPSRISRPLLVGEVRGLVASPSERLVRASLARLEAFGLVAIGETGIIFAPDLFHLKLDDTNLKVIELHRSCRGCEVSTRRLPVPRLMLKHIARGAPPAVAATVMGHLVRSVRWVGKEIHVSGSCTAGFISDFFGVDLRSVRRGRAYLREAGWLVPDVESNSDFGSVPNLVWSPPSRREAGRRAESACTDLSPPRPESDTKMSPPTYSSQLRSGSRSQPQPRRKLEALEKRERASAGPRLSDVTDDVLADPGGVNALFDQAVSHGWVNRTESDRLRFFAAAERAKRVATENPCGFFAAIVRRGWWHVLSQIDEDQAIRSIKGLSEQCERLPQCDGTLDVSTTNKPIMAQFQSLVVELAMRCSMNESSESHNGKRSSGSHSPRSPGHAAAYATSFPTPRSANSASDSEK